MSAVPSIDPGLEATFLPRGGHGGALVLWRRDGASVSAGEVELTLSVGGEPRRVRALRLDPSQLGAVAEWDPGRVSATAASFRELAKVAIRLVERGAAKPAFFEREDAPQAGWRVAPDRDERAALIAVVRRMPPAASAPVHGDVTLDPWQVARAFVDAVADAFVRASAPACALPPGSWEAEIERALADRSGALGRLCSGPRARRSLAEWADGTRARETPRTRLVLRLEPPRAALETGFRLAFALEARDRSGEILGPVDAAAIWAGDVEAHAIADDLEPVRRALREALRRAGQVVAPIEVSLASAAPEAALLTPDEAWAILTRHRATLEGNSCRVAIPEALDGIETRFPKARVRLSRADGAPPDEVSLSPRYRVSWEVVAAGRALVPAALREAARQSPLARLGDVWLPMTPEAGERLAKVAEREPLEWTGPQALAAALAGEVRLAGDLADAEVVPEDGLAALIVELGRDAGDVAPPAGLRASLRAYQQRGLSWLAHRTRLGLGALLADDMGLGKTVQLIALLAHLAERGAPGGPTLLVCPASLVGNWERELARFAPSLKVVRHHGGARLRDADELRSRAGPHDVVVTTYGLVRRDGALLASIAWGTVVCDEAQNLKNALAAQAKAVRALPALRRVALSGTPVENRLTELWSLLEYLNPGLLGPLERFRREIALPIERERDARAARWLRAATAPFLLRRLKSDPAIAPELPEKEIIRVFCSLTEEQARLYKRAVDESLAVIDEAAGIERSGRVLRLLTQLKQVCNHPASLLRDDELAGRSGKLERAAEMLEEIAETGERALVFTQYVEMGRRLAEYFGKRLGVEVPLFEGSLSLPQRDALVASFQREEGGPPVMVMSLRAGGVGLNLTRASHVIHFDRWWNPAVEDQATDRAHRIGQTRRVQVHHLISMGTLEERIDRLLEDKRGLADAVVSGGEAWLTQLSTDELRALVALGSDAAVESLETWEPDARG